MARLSHLLFSGLILVSFASAGCGGGASTSEGGGGAGGTPSAGGAGGGGAGSMVGCTMPAEVPCTDQTIQQLAFLKDVTPGLIENQPDGAGFVSLIDATAGGLNATESYTY